MKGFFKAVGGRKFFMAVIAVIAVVICEHTSISENTIMTIGGTAWAFILAQGWADGQSDGKTSTTSPNSE